MIRVMVMVGVLVAACGGAGLPRYVPPEPPHAAPVPPPSDEAGLRRLLAGEVTDGGLWFADGDCDRRFGHGTKVAAPDFDAFAHCLAGLGLRVAERTSRVDDVSVMTYGPGFEVEAHVADGKLDFIGFAGRGPGVPDLPTITPRTLEALRAAGDPKATVTPELAGQLQQAITGDKSTTPPKLRFYARICLDDSGATALLEPAAVGHPEVAKAFIAATTGWMFRPFSVGGTPMAACAIVAMSYPASSSDPDILPNADAHARSGRLRYLADVRVLERLRLTGTKMVVPQDQDKMELARRSISRLIGTFKLCIDETGHYESGTVLKPTGLPHYDARIAWTMMHQWTYRPYVVDGAPAPVCTTVTFIYSQQR